MPIHLPPFSRRDFLKRSLLAGVGLALAPTWATAELTSDAESWALLSDPHIAADATKVAREINMTEHLIAVGKEVLGLPERPAGLLVCGDLAYNQGTPGDYRQFTSLINPLRAAGLPVHLTLGNHDERGNFWTALATDDPAKRPVADKQVTLLETKKLNWFILDSLEVTRQTPGRLGESQLDWLRKTLDANPQKPAVVFVHHNPGSGVNTGAMKDTAALLEVIRPRRQVKAWIFGHTHVWKLAEDSSGIHLVNLPAVGYVFRPDAPSGWVHALVRDEGMSVELRSLDGKHADHGRKINLAWRAA
ncbi:MAG: metallophosphoesterase [Verrucomicrobiae bacterium]|nr:metallophosphoesterase [Verrucomicrobiae bacterium]